MSNKSIYHFPLEVRALIIFLMSPNSGKLGLLLALFKKDIVHVKQFIVISEKRSLIGLVNIFIYRIASSRIGLLLKSLLR